MQRQAMGEAAVTCEDARERRWESRYPAGVGSPLVINVPRAGPGLSCEQNRTSRKAAPMRHTPASKALAKYKVLDLTRARAGPTAVRQLADWGAQVIKIELPGSDETPDFMDRHSPDFQNLHPNKRSMTLNLKHPEGRDIFLQFSAPRRCDR